MYSSAFLVCLSGHFLEVNYEEKILLQFVVGGASKSSRFTRLKLGVLQFFSEQGNKQVL